MLSTLTSYFLSTMIGSFWLHVRFAPEFKCHHKETKKGLYLPYLAGIGFFFNAVGILVGFFNEILSVRDTVLVSAGRLQRPLFGFVACGRSWARNGVAFLLNILFFVSDRFVRLSWFICACHVDVCLLFSSCLAVGHTQPIQFTIHTGVFQPGPIRAQHTAYTFFGSTPS